MLASFFSVFANNPLLGLIILVAVVFLAWKLTLHWQVWQTRKKIAIMFRGTKAADLEGVIYEQIKRLRQNERDLKELEKFCKNLEKITQHSIQKIGVIRFNPFKDTGGDQSFAIAFLDARNNGFTLSSLFAREGNRVYTKPIENGQSKYPLTEEEKKAIEIATKESADKINKKQE